MVWQCLYVINQILLHAFENMVVKDFNVNMQKLCPRLWLVTLKFPFVVIDAIGTLCVNDHVVHAHTTYHLMHGLQRAG
jgi:hypothetical protein